MKGIRKFLICLLFITGLFLSLYSFSYVKEKSVHASSEITLKSGYEIPKYLYVNHSYNLFVEGEKIKWSVSDTDIASIGTTSGKLTIKKPGSFMVYAKEYNTNRLIAYKKLTSKLRTSEIHLTDDSGNDIDEINLYLDEKFTLKYNMIPENSTDVICFESSDPLIASVTSKGGTISAKSIGSTYVTIYSKETSAKNNSDATNVKDKIKVNVIDNPTNPVLKYITINEATGGTVSIQKLSYYSGEQVKITLNPNYSYVASGLLFDYPSLYYNYIDNSFYFYMPDSDLEVTPVFNKDDNFEYDINLSVNDSLMGSVESSKSKAKALDNITLKATANEGYEFLYYIINGEKIVPENNEYSFKMKSENVSAIAVFNTINASIEDIKEIPKHSISLIQSELKRYNEGPLNIFDGTNTKQFDEGSICTIEFNEEDKEFVKWKFYDSLGNSINNIEILDGNLNTSKISFRVPNSSIKIVASFNLIINTTEKFKVTIIYNPEEDEIVEYKDYNEYITLIAEPKFGYVFDSWNIIGSDSSIMPLSSSSEIKVYVPNHDVTYKALYVEPSSNQYTIELENCEFLFPNEQPPFEIEGESISIYCEEVLNGLEFINYSVYDELGNEITNDISFDYEKDEVINYFVMVNKNIKVVANYSLIKHQIYKDEIKGKVNLSQDFGYYGDIISFSFEPDDGYYLENFEVLGAEIIEDDEYNVSLHMIKVLNNDIVIKPSFSSLNSEHYSITILNDGNGCGGLYNNEYYEYNVFQAEENTSISLMNFPLVGYKLSHFESISGGISEEELSGGSFLMPASNVVLKVYFEKEPHTINLSTNGYGKIESSSTNGLEFAGSEVLLTVIPYDGYEFGYFEVVNGDIIVNDNSFIMPGIDVEIKAYFKLAEYSINILPSENGIASCDITSGNKGNVVVLSYRENEGYKFKEWQVLSGNITIENNTFVIQNENVEIRAIFEFITPDPLDPTIDPIDPVIPGNPEIEKNLSPFIIIIIVIGSLLVVADILYFVGYFFYYKKGKLENRKIEKIYKIFKK